MIVYLRVVYTMYLVPESHVVVPPLHSFVSHHRISARYPSLRYGEGSGVYATFMYWVRILHFIDAVYIEAEPECLCQ